MKKARANNYSFSFHGIVISILLLFLFFATATSVHASLAEDLIAREGWRKVSMDLEQTSLLSILKIFSQQSGLNFVASPEIASKSVTLYLENVPLREALEKILNANKLMYALDEESNIFIVKQLIEPEVELITKVFHLQYAQLAASPVNKDSTTQHEGIIGAIKDRMSSYGKLTEDTRTNSIIISDVPFAMQQIEVAVAKLDVPVPQVIIEVEIIDTEKGLVDQLGFNITELSDNFFSYILPGYRIPATIDAIQGGSFRGQMTFGDSAGESGTPNALNLLRSSSSTKILARPKILTLSNQKAEIKITRDAVISTKTTLDDLGNVSGIEAEREEIGVTLTVTPSVNLETGKITMALEPSVKSVSDALGFQDDLGNPLKNVDERSAKVTLVVDNNQTLVLGGLLQEDKLESRSRVAFLGDIPFFGALFRSVDKTPYSDREMLVFVTPRIVEPDSRLGIQTQQANYDPEVLAQREQSDFSFRREKIDKTLSAWDNY